jgi:hypothetical protein
MLRYVIWSLAVNRRLSVLIKHALTERNFAAQPQREAARLLVDNTTSIMTLCPAHSN